MYLVNVSHSKLENHRECPYKYFVRYHEHLPEQRSDGALQFGSYIHKILERGLNEFTLSGLQAIADEEKKNYKFETSYNSKIKTCLKNFLSFNTKISVSKNVGNELKEAIEFDDIKYTGIIDRVKESADGSILIIDYKTSKTEKTRLDLAVDKQLIGYAVIYSMKFKVPISKITCAHYYPLTNNFISVKYPMLKSAQFINEIKAEVWKIRKKTSIEQFTPIRNKYCNWCGFQKYCSLFNDSFTIQKNITEAKALVESKSKSVP